MENVSRETLDKLELFLKILFKWNKKINLVKDVDNIWHRHIENCMHVCKYIENSLKIADIGSGAGFPGIIIAIMNPECHITLIETNTKKSIFLTEVISNLNLNCRVINNRVEKTNLREFDIITCRAFASIKKLFDLIKNNVSRETKYLLLKGENFQKEIDEAQNLYSFDYKILAYDRTNIIKIHNLKN